MKLRPLFALASMAAASFAPASASAQAIPGVFPVPANDNFADAEEVDAVPFVRSVDTMGASIEIGEPRPCRQVNTVWYKFTPSQDRKILFETGGSNFPAVVGIYDGSAIESLRELTRCEPGDLSVSVRAGHTYYLQVGGGVLADPLDLSIYSDRSPRFAGNLEWSVQRETRLWKGGYVPMLNDRIEDATTIDVPGGGSGILHAATWDPSEPTHCLRQRNHHENSYPNRYSTVWYRHTASQQVPLSASVYGRASTWSSTLGIYRETPDGLEFLKCAEIGDPYPVTLIDARSTLLRVDPDETLLFQVGTPTDTAHWGPVSFTLKQVKNADIEAVRVEANPVEDSGDPTKGRSLNISMDFAIEDEQNLDPFNFYTAHWRLEACPVGMNRCWKIREDFLRFDESGLKTKYNFEWPIPTCVGDVDLKMTAVPLGFWDTDASNNDAVARLTLAPASIGIGACDPHSWETVFDTFAYAFFQATDPIQPFLPRVP